jgi:hypothetical protein
MLKLRLYHIGPEVLWSAVRQQCHVTQAAGVEFIRDWLGENAWPAPGEIHLCRGALRNEEKKRGGSLPG